MSRPVRTRVWVLVGVLFVLHFLMRVGFQWGIAAPDLLTVGLLLTAREIGLARAATIGFGFGLLEDALSALAFGANSIAMTLTGIGGALTRDLFVGDSRRFVVSYFFLGKWVRDVLHWVSVGEGLRQPFVDQVLVQGGLASAYAALVGLALVEIAGLSGES